MPHVAFQNASGKKGGWRNEMGHALAEGTGFLLVVDVELVL